MNIMYIDEYLKKRSNKKSSFKMFFTKLLVLSFIFLITIISIKKEDNIKEFLSDKVFSKNFSFSHIKGLYTKYLGSVLPFDSMIDIEPVFNEELKYNDINKYKDGYVLSVDDNYLVPVQYSGIIVFVGEKEDYGNTVIIESEDVTIWYCNINSDVKLYDEVTSGKYLGEVVGNKLYLVFQKEGDLVDYKNYI